MLDDTNAKIIEQLSVNARMPLLQIARKLDMPESTVRKRLNQMENQGIIKQYSLVVDHQKIGMQNLALVGVDVEPDHYLELSQKLKDIEGVKYAASTAGDHMFMLEILTKDSEQLTEICDNIRKLRGVTRICPAIVKETLKGTL